MKKAKKTFLAVACAGVLVIGSVAATMAYLTATTDTVTNTFTVGNVSFNSGDLGNAIDEASVNEYGQKLDSAGAVYDENKEGAKLADRVTENKYKLVPGHTYTKDPIVHMGADTEAAWLFVKVDNAISAIEDSSNTIANQMETEGWIPVAEGSSIYYYKDQVTARDNIEVFKEFKLKTDVSNDVIKSYEGKTITIQAYAVQADGFTTAADAWAAAPLEAWTK